MERKEQLALILRDFGPANIRAALQTPQRVRGPLPRGAITTALGILKVSRSSLYVWLAGENSPAVEAAIAGLQHPSQDDITRHLADLADQARTYGLPVPLPAGELVALLPIPKEEQQKLLPRLRDRLNLEGALALLLPLIPARFAELLWRTPETDPEEEEERKRKEQIEAKAQQLYNGWKFDPEWRPWKPGGNSLMQNLARSQAAEELFPQVPFPSL